MMDFPNSNVINVVGKSMPDVEDVKSLNRYPKDVDSQSHQVSGYFYVFLYFKTTRAKSLLESWGPVPLFFSDWQPSLTFVWFTSKSHEHYLHY